MPPEKRLTQIGNKAARHCGNVVGVGRIGFVAVRTRCAGAPATAGPFTQERPIKMTFANPSSVVASGAVPHRRAHLWQRKTNVGAGIAFQGSIARKSRDGFTPGKIGKMIRPVLNITFRQRFIGHVLIRLPFWQVGRTMSSFDPMAAVVDWLDAYRAATLSIVDLYAPDAVLECGCNGQATVIGRRALTEYWRQPFDEKPSGELQSLQVAGDMIVVSYEVPGGIVQATIKFNDAGLIIRSQCGPSR